MKGSRFRRACILAISVLAAIGVYAESDDENTAVDTIVRVAILTDGSSFKQQVIDDVNKMAIANDVRITVMRIDDFSDWDSDEYDRYIFLCKIVGGRVEKNAYAIFQKLEGEKQVLFGLTHFFNPPIPENARKEVGSIDAVTSASKKANIKRFAVEIYQWISHP